MKSERRERLSLGRDEHESSAVLKDAESGIAGRKEATHTFKKVLNGRRITIALSGSVIV